MKRPLALALAALALGVVLVGCSDDEPETPAVCGSVDSLRASVDDIKNIDVTSSSAVSDLESGITAVEGDLTDVKNDASAEFSTQVDAVDTAFGSVKDSVDAAKADPTASTLGAVGDAISSFDDAFQTLTTDVQSTC